jgi:hypothetical protein
MHYEIEVLLLISIARRYRNEYMQAKNFTRTEHALRLLDLPDVRTDVPRPIWANRPAVPAAFQVAVTYALFRIRVEWAKRASLDPGLGLPLCASGVSDPPGPRASLPRSS